MAQNNEASVEEILESIKKVIARDNSADALRDAQRAWIPYRDKACAAYGYLARGGTLEPQLIYSCRADLTRSRVSELEELAGGLGN